MTTLLQTIGHTPMIQLTNIIERGKIHLYAKLEGQNPGGSIKDRAALYMIEQAEQRGELTKNKIILEATSGNMGIALAMIGAQKGYQVHIVMSEGMSQERKIMLKTLGATLILTHKQFGTEGAIQKAKELQRQSPSTYWFANQFNNPDNTAAHYHGISKEILQDVAHIDYFIAGIGTSGTMMGIARRLRHESPKTKIIGVIPETGYTIQGLQNPYKDFRGVIYDETVLDEQIRVLKDNAYAMARSIAKTEGLFVGMSSGANLYAAYKKAKSIREGIIVTILPDRGEKYMSTGMFY